MTDPESPDVAPESAPTPTPATGARAESGSEVGALLARVAALEARVAELERSSPPRPTAAPYPPSTSALDARHGAFPDVRPPPPAGAFAPMPAPAPRRDPVDWVSRAGIALLVLGCGFLFKYSVDQGWLGHGARVGFGFALTVALFGLGTRFRHRPAFGDVLTGGAVACALVTLFAAHVLYALLPFAVAFAGCAAASLVAFVLAVRREREPIAVTALLGAYSAPFVLDAPETATPFLVGFLFAATFSGGAAAAARPWLALHALGAIGAFVCVALVGDRSMGTTLPLVYLTGAWTAFAALPLARSHNPARDRSAGAIAIATTLGSTFLAQVLLEAGSAGQAIVGGMALVTGLLGAWSMRTSRGCASAAAATCAVAVCACASFSFRPLDELPGVFGVVGAGLFVLSRRTAVRAPATTWLLLTIGLLSACVASYVLGVSSAETWTIGGGISTLTAIGAYALVSASTSSVVRRGFPPILAQIALFGWTASVLVEPFGPPIVSIAWGAIAVTELAAGMIRRHRPLQQLGLAGVGALMVKLVLLDLANTPALWRILLFMGFGAVFLGLGYVAARLEDKAT